MWRRLLRRLGGQALITAEAEAQIAQDRLREAIDVLPEGIVFLDAEGRYILWNRRYAEIYHRSADLFAPGRKLADTLRTGVERGDYPDAVGREEAWLAERLARLETPMGERHEQRLADGRWLMIEERGTADGGVIGLRVDITEMKRQAEALEQALARAEAANRAKNEFLADMSHELRTPLNGVMGLADALARTALDHTQAALVQDILGSASALSRLITGLLDYGDIEMAPPAEAGPHLGAPGAGEDQPAVRVLLADDNPTNRKVIELMLGATDAVVRSVENGALAVEAWRAAPYDVVLMDLRMPVMDGLEAIRAIRLAEAERGGARTPIVVLSANTSSDDRKASAEAGADAHIAKPIRADELFMAIGGVLEG
jgi:CheY-like chemotaxis protein/PAS domain-containing protein